MGSSSHMIEETTPANLSTVKQLKDKSLTHKLWLILVISTVSGDIFKRRESTASMNSLLLVCVLVVGASAFPQSQSGCGADDRGALRKPGDSWQETCNRCRCLASGRPGCTRKFCGDFPSLAEPVESKRDNPSPVAAAGVNFPGSKQQPKDTAVTGQDTNTGQKHMHTLKYGIHRILKNISFLFLFLKANYQPSIFRGHLVHRWPDQGREQDR